MLQARSNAGNPKPRTTQNDLPEIDGAEHPLFVGLRYRVFRSRYCGKPGMELSAVWVREAWGD